MTLQTLSSSFPVGPAAPRGNILVLIAHQLIKADQRAPDRRRLQDLPDHLRADLGLPRRSHRKGTVWNLILQADLLR
jgi:hypothetical protein